MMKSKLFLTVSKESNKMLSNQIIISLFNLPFLWIHLLRQFFLCNIKNLCYLPSTIDVCVRVV